jgi:predicted DNA binding CopG/RHH family protein
MKKNLSKAELDSAEAAFAKQIYKDRAKVEKQAQGVMAAMRTESSQITIRLKNSEIHLAKQQAAAKGLPYQTYIKMLLHQALRAGPETGASGITAPSR